MFVASSMRFSCSTLCLTQVWKAPKAFFSTKADSLDDRKLAYLNKGYSETWVDKRIQGIAIRQKLLHDWVKSGIKKDFEFQGLSKELYLKTFGMTPANYKIFKQLKRENLRDHMTEQELHFMNFAENSAIILGKKYDAQGFQELSLVASIAGDYTRCALEQYQWKHQTDVVSKVNYLWLKNSLLRKN